MFGRMDPYRDALRELPEGSLYKLAELLAAPLNMEPEIVRAAQRIKIRSIPEDSGFVEDRYLVRKTGSYRLFNHKLCYEHKKLRSDLMSWCLVHLTEWISLRADKLRFYRRRFGDECPDEIEEYIYRISGIASLWLDDRQFERDFGYVPQQFKFRTLKHPCAACILSVIGARAQMLIDLRALMVSKNQQTRFQPLIEAWIDVLQDEKTTIGHLRDESDVLASELRRIIHLVKKYNTKRRRARWENEKAEGKPWLEKRDGQTAFVRKPSKEMGAWAAWKADVGQETAVMSGWIRRHRSSSRGSTKSTKSTDSPNTSYSSDPASSKHNRGGLASRMRELNMGRDDGRSSRPHSTTSSKRYADIPARLSSVPRSDRDSPDDNISVFRGRRSTVSRDATDRRQRTYSASPPGNERRRRSSSRDSTVNEEDDGIHQAIHASIHHRPPLDTASEDSEESELDTSGWKESDFADRASYESCMAIRKQVWMQAKVDERDRKLAERREKLAAEALEADRRERFRPRSRSGHGSEEDDFVGDLPSFNNTPKNKTKSTNRGDSRASGVSSKSRRTASSSRYSGAPSDTYETIRPESPPPKEYDSDSDSDSCYSDDSVDTRNSRHQTFTIPPGPGDDPNRSTSVLSSSGSSIRVREEEALDKLTKQIHRKSSRLDVSIDEEGMPDMPSLRERMDRDPFLQGKRCSGKLDGRVEEWLAEEEEVEGWETDILEKERGYIRKARRDGSIRPGTRYRDVTREDYGGR
jgi:hypothetical protein